MAPADGGAQGAVARRPERGVVRYLEAGPDPGGDLFDGVPAEGSGGEFDGERNAFEAAADLGGGLGVPRFVEGESGAEAAARSRKSVSASAAPSTGSGSTSTSCSPLMSRGCRLVASTVRPGTS